MGNKNQTGKLEKEIRKIQIPEGVLREQLINSDIEDGKEEQVHTAVVNLFFSFDIVNSTLFKSQTSNWAIIIKGLLNNLKELVTNYDVLSTCRLWRVIGDELIFIMPLDYKEQINPAIDAIFEVVQKVDRSLKRGKFFEGLDNQDLQKSEIQRISKETHLSIKSAAWMAAVNSANPTEYDCIKFNYSPTANNKEIVEYIGRDIDTGFRLKNYTRERRLVVSFELAYFISKTDNADYLNIIDYCELKGVWNGNLYPIIWYHNEKIFKEVNSEDRKTRYNLIDSFKYDEIIFSEAGENFWFRDKNSNFSDKMFNLKEEMYKISTAFKRICIDNGFEEKMDYLNKLLNQKTRTYNVQTYAEPLELHCAVVCCDVNNKKIMITRRSEKHITNPEKWEFGCAKINSNDTLINTISSYYKDYFGIEIDLVLDKKRHEKQPVPIAVYEIEKNSNIIKGIIFIARVKTILHDEYRSNDEHNELKWINEDEIELYASIAVSDFEKTAKYVFENFDEIFSND